MQNLPVEEKVFTPFELWINDWMAQNRPAENISVSCDILSTAEIMHKCYMEIMDNSITQEDITKSLSLHEYVFENGGWMIK